MDKVAPLPGINHTPVKPYYGGTKLMYQRENSPEFNSKALVKTGMRDAGASIINGLETPTLPASHLPTPSYRNNKLTPITNPSYITHSHSKPNFSEMNGLDNSI